jgi:hypothetical protein
MARPRAIFQLCDGVDQSRRVHLHMLMLSEFRSVTASTIGLVRSVFPRNHFVIRRVTGVARSEAMCLVANTDVAIGVGGRPDSRSVT